MSDAISFSGEGFSLRQRVGNAVMGRLLRTRLGAKLEPVWLLEVKGRRTGRMIRTPVGLHELDGQHVFVGGGRWRFNFADGGHPFTLIRSDRRVEGTGVLVRDPDEVAGVYEGLIAKYAEAKDVAHAARMTGARLQGDRVPSREEVLAAITAVPREVVRLDLGGQ